MKLKIAQVIGLNTDQKAAQVSSATREDETFLAVLQQSCDDAFTKGRQALSELEDFFFEAEGNAGEKLTATFEEADKKFAESEVDLMLAVITGKVLYLIGRGQVEAYLKRSGKLSPLLSVGAPAQLISGFMTAEDRLLFGTKTLIDFLGEDLEKILNLPIDVFEEELGGKIGASETENEGLAALSLAVEEEASEIPTLPEVSESITADKPIFDRKVLMKTVLENTAAVIKKSKAYFPKSGRGRLILAIVLIVILVAGTGYKYKAGKDKEKNLQFSQTYQRAKDDFEAAKGLASLNPADAKAKLDLAGSDLDAALRIKPKDKDALDLKKQIEAEAPSILQQSAVTDFPVFLDMDLVKKNFRARQMSLSGGKLLLLDPEVKTLVVVDIVKKSNQVLAGSEQLGEADFASVNGGSAFVYSKDKGVLKTDTGSSKVTVVAKEEDNFGNIKDIYGFAGNVYLLDSGKNMIWKYLPTSEGYSDAREYFSKDSKYDLGSAIRMQIESSVYVLKSGGEILRFTKGDKDNFSFSGLPSGVKDPKSIFTSSDVDNLYVLDSGNSRMLILTKTGSYKGQITGSRFGTATDLTVDEIGKKVYLLDGSKIYSVDLK